MADFEPSFEKMIKNEGGYVLHTVPGDNGGQTYAGIARNFHSSWKGWEIIDRDDMDNEALTEMVREFYKENFWDKVKGDDMRTVVHLHHHPYLKPDHYSPLLLVC